MRRWRAFIVDSRPTVIVRELQFAADPVELRNRQYSLDERRNYHVLPVAEIYLQDKDICVAKPRSLIGAFVFRQLLCLENKFLLGFLE